MKQFIIAIAGLALLGACATHYTTPAGGVSLTAISDKDEDIADAFSREPAMEFPARLAIARVAAAGYRSMTNTGYGTGAFSVVTTRDIEGEDAVERLAKMPKVAAVAPMARIILPTQLQSTRDLRQSAAQLKADAILIYTLDTSFRTESTQIGPLQTIALGMFNTENAIVTSTCSFAIIDVRTGFIYGVGETTASEEKRSNMWGTRDATDKARMAAETKAFDDAVVEVGKLWLDIVLEHATRS
jgi:acyl-CoA synthetase (AMP-forming)/AMP-acid ligase II